MYRCSACNTSAYLNGVPVLNGEKLLSVVCDRNTKNFSGTPCWKHIIERIDFSFSPAILSYYKHSSIRNTLRTTTRLGYGTKLPDIIYWFLFFTSSLVTQILLAYLEATTIICSVFRVVLGCFLIFHLFRSSFSILQQLTYARKHIELPTNVRVLFVLDLRMPLLINCTMFSFYILWWVAIANEWYAEQLDSFLSAFITLTVLIIFILKIFPTPVYDFYASLPEHIHEHALMLRAISLQYEKAIKAFTSSCHDVPTEEVGRRKVEVHKRMLQQVERQIYDGAVRLHNLITSIAPKDVDKLNFDILQQDLTKEVNDLVIASFYCEKLEYDNLLWYGVLNEILAQFIGPELYRENRLMSECENQNDVFHYLARYHMKRVSVQQDIVEDWACSRCGKTGPNIDNHCDHCGVSVLDVGVDETCHRCGRTVSDHNNYCCHCGSLLGVTDDATYSADYQFHLRPEKFNESPKYSNLLEKSIVGIITRMALGRIGSRTGITNVVALQRFEQGVRLGVDAIQTVREQDSNAKRMAAMRPIIEAVEVCLHTRLDRSFDKKTRGIWIRKRGKQRDLKMNSLEKSVQRWLQDERMPSLSMIAAWLKKSEKIKPPELGEKIQRSLYVPVELASCIGDFGDLRNVLAHLPEYESDRRNLGNASKYLIEEEAIGGRRSLDISDDMLMELETICKRILSSSQ